MVFETKESERLFHGLHEMAIEICEQYILYHMKKNKEYKGKPDQQSYLAPSARLKEGMSIGIIWSKSYFQKKDGKTIHRSKYIQKGNSTVYNTDTLLKLAPEWEHALIIETEAKLSKIRAALAQITKIGIHVRLLNKRLEELDSK